MNHICPVCSTQMAQMFYFNSYKCPNLCDKKITTAVSHTALPILWGTWSVPDWFIPMKDKLEKSAPDWIIANYNRNGIHMFGWDYIENGGTDYLYLVSVKLPTVPKGSLVPAKTRQGWASLTGVNILFDVDRSASIFWTLATKAVTEYNLIP